MRDRLHATNMTRYAIRTPYTKNAIPDQHDVDVFSFLHYREELVQVMIPSRKLNQQPRIEAGQSQHEIQQTREAGRLYNASATHYGSNIPHRTAYSEKMTRLTSVEATSVLEKLDVVIVAPQHTMEAPPYSAVEPEKVLSTTVSSTRRLAQTSPPAPVPSSPVPTSFWLKVLAVMVRVSEPPAYTAPPFSSARLDLKVELVISIDSDESEKI